MTGRIVITARINDHCGPIDRGELYEDPLDDIMQANGIGEVLGGGTQLTDDNEIAFCDLEIALNVPESKGIEFVIRELNKLGVPKGSLIISEVNQISLGTTEGLAFYFDNINLPDFVYENNSINDAYERFGELIKGIGEIHAHWNGEEETAIYMYGSSFSAIKAALADYIASNPLCQGARIVQSA